VKRLGVLLLVLALAGCSGDGPPAVAVEPVARATVAETVDAPGTVSARAVASVTAPTDAVVAEVLVQDRAQVEQGAVLVRLASPAAQERLRTAVAARDQAAGAAVQVPRSDLEPVQDALDAAAEQAFTAARAAAAQLLDPVARDRAEQEVAQSERQYATASNAARATLRQLGDGAESLERALAAVAGSQELQAQAAVDLARATVEALTVLAPITGVVSLGAGGGAEQPGAGDLGGLLDELPAAVQGQASAALGASAGGAATETAGLAAGRAVRSGAALLTVTDLGGLTAVAEVDETDVLLVAPGTPAQVEVDAVPGAVYAATVTSVDLAPTTSSRGGVSYGVRLRLDAGLTTDDEPAPPPRPGMSAVVDLRVRTSQDVLAVPAAAVVRGAARDAVFVVQDGRAVRREVRLGAQGEDLVEVLAGLEEGTPVVVRDADRLSDGQAVTS